MLRISQKAQLCAVQVNGLSVSDNITQAFAPSQPFRCHHRHFMLTSIVCWPPVGRKDPKDASMHLH